MPVCMVPRRRIDNICLIYYHLLPSSTAFGLCFMAFIAFIYGRRFTMDIIQVIGQMGKRHVFLCVLIVFPKL